MIQRLQPKYISTLLAGCIATILHGCRDEQIHTDLPSASAPTDQLSTVVASESSGDETGIEFRDATANTGIEFRYFGAPSPEQYMTEQNGGGIAVDDFDRDGNLDLFFVNGSHFAKPSVNQQDSSQLYLNTEKMTFRQVTTSSGLTSFGHGMGCSAADYDNDGFCDIYVAHYGEDKLWQNMGDGTFQNVTEYAAVSDDNWSTSSAFADLNGDGLLDLFVVNYVEWRSSDPPCHDPEHPKIRRTCSPLDRNAQKDRLYLNLGDGRFNDIAEIARLADADSGKGLAIEICDLTDDGRLDVYVANDTTENKLFINQGNLTFEDCGVRAGVAVSSDGVRGASMGIGCADYNLDGHWDLIVTNFRNQVKDLYAGVGGASFISTNTETGLDLRTRRFLSFGVVFQDFDLDGWADLFIANGHIWDLTSLGPQYEYKMPASVLRNKSGTAFTNIANPGSYFSIPTLGRAVSYGDLDNDGDLDLVVQHIDAPAAILANESKLLGSIKSIQFIGTESARQPLGCRVTAVIGEDQRLFRIPSGGSFQVSHSPLAYIVIPNGKKLTSIEITWPNGRLESWNIPDQATSSYTFIESTGKLRNM